MRNFLIKTISSFFYVGYLPLLPGTFGSIAAAALIWLFKDNPVGCVAFGMLITLAGFIVSAAAEKIFKRKDAECIVIDEVAGMFLSLLFLPVNAVSLFCAFLLFRGFDAMKIYPADKMQRLGGAKGVMLDDVVAAVYTNLILQVALRLFS
jgi:phosphatidylglycerophosphatase A